MLQHSNLLVDGADGEGQQGQGEVVLCGAGGIELGLWWVDVGV